MTQLTNFRCAASALDSLGIVHRSFPSKSSEFYFCTVPSTGITFDLQYDVDGIRLWRFVGTAPISKADTKFEYHIANSSVAIGYEVTEDGDISLYAEQRININDSKCNRRIENMIRSYVALISDPSMANFSL